MDRSSILRFLAIGGLVFLFLQFVYPKIAGTDGPKTQPIPKEGLTALATRPAEETCKLKGTRFSAELSSRGGRLLGSFAVVGRGT